MFKRRTITRDELEVILRKHKLWLVDDPKGERADLSRADLSRADLTEANLTEADLSRADLYEANLTEADLTEANLYGADLTGANLYGADHLDTAKNVYYPLACPEEGSFIGFKKVRDDYIVKLEIPEDALRSSAVSRKCRCSHAKVISITNIDGTPANVEYVYSRHDVNFAYKVGEVVKVDDFDPDRWHECAPGIHFFITRQEAVDY